MHVLKWSEKSCWRSHSIEIYEELSHCKQNHFELREILRNFYFHNFWNFPVFRLSTVRNFSYNKESETFATLLYN